MPGSSHRPRSGRRPSSRRPTRGPSGPLRSWEEEVAAGRAAAVGRLSSGVVHALNNPLTVILGSVHLALETLPNGHALAPQLRAIERAATRSRQLVRSLLEFSRLGDASADPFDLGDALSAAAGLVEPLARYRCLELRFEVAGRPMPLRGRPGDMQIAFIHLAGHLIDTAAPGGMLNLRAKPAGAWAEVRLEREAGGAAPPARIGQPQPIGLSLASEIVRRHGGSLLADGGTVFQVRLPLADGRPA